MLYGGSVKAKNVGEIVAEPDIDGAWSVAPAWTPTSSRSSARSPRVAPCLTVRRRGHTGLRPVSDRVRRTAGTLGFPSADVGGADSACDENEDGMQLALQIVLIISSVLLVLLILLHRGRGGGLSSLFGGGVQSSLSGSSVVEKNLDRLTLFVGAIWVIAIIGTGLLVKVGV